MNIKEQCLISIESELCCNEIGVPSTTLSALPLKVYFLCCIFIESNDEPEPKNIEIQ